MFKRLYDIYKLKNSNDNIKIFNLDGYKGYIKIVNIYDGDTFRAVVRIHNRNLKFTFRPIGYDAPEMKPRLDTPNRDNHIKQAHQAKKYFEDLISYDNKYKGCCFCKSQNIVYAECYKNDKYGRVLVNIFHEKGFKKSINTMMLESGLTMEYDGGTKKEFKNLITK